MAYVSADYDRNNEEYFWAECDCGWEGPNRVEPATAESDAEDHERHCDA